VGWIDDVVRLQWYEMSSNDINSKPKRLYHKMQKSTNICGPRGSSFEDGKHHMWRRCEMSDVLTEAAKELAVLQAELAKDVLRLAMDNMMRILAMPVPEPNDTSPVQTTHRPQPN
jgi:hypothetical protein